MPPAYTFNYKEIRIKVKGNSRLIFKWLTILFTVLITIMFVGAMTGGFFGLGSRQRTLNFARKEYYALSAGSFDTRQTAEAAAHSLKVRGVAGYIHKDKAFMALAALYLNQNDAQAVAVRMESGFSVYKIALPPFKLPSTGDSAADTKVKNAVEFVYALIDGLYAAVIGYDSGVMSAEDVFKRLKSLKESAAAHCAEVESVRAEGGLAHTLILLRAELFSVSVNLAALNDTALTQFSFSVNLKYTLLRTAI